MNDRYSFQFLLLISGFCHGLIFNLLHKSLNASLTNDTITSLAVHLLELAVTYPQKDFSGKEVAVAVQVIIFFANIRKINKLTPPIAEILCVKNVGAFVVCRFLMK